MAKVTCTRPNASELINGVPFAREDGAMVAYGVSDEAASVFAECDGYIVDLETVAAARVKESAQTKEKEEPRRGRPPKEVPSA